MASHGFVKLQDQTDALNRESLLKKHTATHTENILLLLPLLLIVALLGGCSNAVEEVSKRPTPVEKTPPKVVAQLTPQLQDAVTKNLTLQATLILNNTNDYPMSIDNGAASWQQADLPVESPYDLEVRFEIATGGGSVDTLVVAQAQAVHDFSTQATKTFEAGDLSTAFDTDGDGMTNLDEFNNGLNPQNDGPTFQTNPLFQVPDKQNTTGEMYYFVGNVEAKSPRANASLTYSLAGGANKARFFIDANTGALSFVDNTPSGGQPWPTFNATGNNDYRVDIQATDGTRSTVLPVTVTVIKAFNLSVSLGLKTLQFAWLAVPGATYYKLLEKPDGSAGFTEVPGATYVEGLSFGYYLALHRLDPLKARYLLEAYDASGSQLEISDEFFLPANLDAAIGYVKSTQTAAGGRFGQAVALSADGTTIAVGAPYENSYMGAVHIYRRVAGIWQPQGVVTAPNGAASDWFGWSLALSTDGATLAVGAYGEDSAATGVGGNQQDDCLNLNGSPNLKSQNCALGSGAVYVYEARDKTGKVGWGSAILAAYVKASNTGADNRFGRSVALSADGLTLAVGAYWENSAATGVGGKQQDDCWNLNGSVGTRQNCASYSGAVYVYEARDKAGKVVWGSASPSAYIKASNTGAGDLFGSSVALSAEGATLVVGALFESSAATGVGGNPKDDCGNPKDSQNNCAINSGAVYVYEARDKAGKVGWGSAILVAYIKASNTEAFDQFGWSVALNAAANSLAVGAYGEGSAATWVGGNQQYDCLTQINCASGSGAVYLY